MSKKVRKRVEQRIIYSKEVGRSDQRQIEIEYWKRRKGWE
jgi:hypothetical protein